MKRFIGSFAITMVLTIQVMAQAQKGISIVVVDPTLPSLNILVKQIHPRSKVVYLDKTGNPLHSILSILKANAPISALHILSEGKPGSLVFSGIPVTTAMLDEFTDVLGNWKEHFTGHGDILLYGCDVAKGEDGIQFVKSMAVYTGLDIAASDNPTGTWRKGGDWFLEIKSGRIETRLAVSQQIIEQYPAVLGSSSKPKVLRNNH